MMIKDSALTMPRTCVAADMVVALDSVDSTNTYAAEQLREGHLFGSEKYISADGFSMCDWTGREIVAICADEQTAGRGRLDHQWVSVKGESFIVSLVATVPASIVRDTSVNGWLQMIAGLAVRDAVAGVVIDFDGTLDGKIELKWPNDIFVGGKKLGGVLAEMVPLAGTSAAEEPDMDGGSAGSAGSEEGASKERVGIADGGFALDEIGIIFGIENEQLFPLHVDARRSPSLHVREYLREIVPQEFLNVLQLESNLRR